MSIKKELNVILITTITAFTPIACIGYAKLQATTIQPYAIKVDKTQLNQASTRPQLNKLSNTTDIKSLLMASLENNAPDIDYQLTRFLTQKNDFKSAQAQRENWNERVTVIRLLGEKKAECALDTLNGFLSKSNNISAIFNSAREIGRIGGGKAYNILQSVLNKPNSYRAKDRINAAIIGLGLCGNKYAIKMLIKILFDKNNDQLTRIYAAGSLGILGNKDGYTTALLGLKSTNSKILTSALTSLGFIADHQALEEVSSFNRQSVKYVIRKRAQLATAMIKSAGLSDKNKVDFIVDELNDNPTSTELVQWGTGELKSMNTSYSVKCLEELALQKKLDFLSFIAYVKLKTLPNKTTN